MEFLILLLVSLVGPLAGLGAAAVYLWLAGEPYTERYVAVLDSKGRPTSVYVVLPR